MHEATLILAKLFQIQRSHRKGFEGCDDNDKGRSSRAFVNVFLGLDSVRALFGERPQGFEGECDK